MRSAKDVLAAQLDDPAFRAEWTRLAPARSVARRLVADLADHGLTQTALDRRLGLPQPAVARLEAADHLPSLAPLVRLAEALDIEFLVNIKPHRRPSSWVSPATEQAKVLEKVGTLTGGEILIAAS